MASKKGGKTIQATKSSFAIIEQIRELDGATLRELDENINLAKSSIHNHLKTLEELEYITWDGEIYQLGLKFLDHGMYLRTNCEPYNKAREKTRILAEQTGEKAQFVVEEHGYGVFLHCEHGENAVQSDTRIGTRVYLHATASGKAILAHLPEAQIEEVINSVGLQKRTQNTITSREQLYEELQSIRDEGLAYNHGEHLSGAWSVGAPVMASDGSVLGGISVSTPANRVKAEGFETEISNALLGIVNELELEIAYS